VDVTIVTLGGDIEGSEFWRGYDVERGGQNWMDRADVVVLPAFVEHRPGRLLQAAAAGIPVIASTACGVEGVDGIETLDWGDVEGLRAAIKRKLVNAEVRL
jgi:glycosyltransferase involved in cell wall biosynthesis